MNRTPTMMYSVALIALLLQACTINVYKNNDTGSSATPELSIATTQVKEQFGTVSAAEIMTISTTPNGPLISADDSVALEVVLSVDAYVSCFYQQNNGNIIKLFPNRVIPAYRINSGQVLRIPGANGFRVLTNKAETKESYMCLASSEDVTPNLPLEYQANSYPQVPVTNFDKLFQVYRQSTNNNLIARVLDISNRQPALPDRSPDKRSIHRSMSLSALY